MYVYLIKISYYEQKKPVQNLCRSTNKTNDSIQGTISVIFPFSANIFLIVRFCVFNIRQIEVYIHFSGVMTFFLSICFSVFQSSQKASIEHLEQVRSLRTILWPSNLGECKTMMPSVLQYYLEFANIFWNNPTFSTMKKSNLLVDCLDSFWMTASSQYVINITNCLLWLQHTSSKWTFDNWPNTIRTAFTLMGFRIIEWYTFTWQCSVARSMSATTYVDLNWTPHPSLWRI